METTTVVKDFQKEIKKMIEDDARSCMEMMPADDQVHGI